MFIFMSAVSDIKKKVKEQLQNELKTKKVILDTLMKVDAYGHEAGMPFEDWVRDVLSKNWDISPPNEFVVRALTPVKKDEEAILQYLSKQWWGELLFCKKQIRIYLEGKHVDRWQQEGADLVIFYGKDLQKEPEKVILLNVKSHEVNRDSRPPNIMSAQRLLMFFHNITRKPNFDRILNFVELWFVGVSWEASKKGAIVKDVVIKDLFKLDVEKIPQINFDAAIQIQWHVIDMVEKEQTKIEFIENLSSMFIQKWKRHSESKGKKYEKLVDDIKKGISQRQSSLYSALTK